MIQVLPGWLASLHARVARRGRSLILAACAGLFLALSGAFGTSAAPLTARLGYWPAIMVGGSLWGGVVAEALSRRIWFADRTLALGAVMCLLIGPPFTLVVFFANHVVFGLDLRPASLLYLGGPVLVVTAAMTALNLALRAPPPMTDGAHEGPPRFLERLPTRLRGAALWAVEAQDHYLRVHTDRGAELILMRLSDALAELQGVEGAQVHRSWWVARGAVLSARRRDGRASLSLKGGLEAPVSRRYARALREAGWF